MDLPILNCLIYSLFCLRSPKQSFIYYYLQTFIFACLCPNFTKHFYPRLVIMIETSFLADDISDFQHGKK